MKLFHTEKGKEVVYVQMQDIMFLSNSHPRPISRANSAEFITLPTAFFVRSSLSANSNHIIAEM